jgi:aspartate carbamoyltransferase catalytic subunit
MNGLTSVSDLSRTDLLDLFSEADEIMERGEVNGPSGRLLAPLLFRPSGDAVLRIYSGAATLGASVLAAQDVWPGFPTGVALHEAIEAVARHADLVILRHPAEGVARRLAESGTPVLNAGDGARGDPLAGLVALDGLRTAMGEVGGRTVAICGDLGRNPVVHTILRGLALLGAKILLVPAEASEMPEGLMADLALQLGGSPVRFPAHSLRTFLDMVDTVFLAPHGGSQLGLFDQLPPTSEDDRRRTWREARSVDAMVLAAPCDADGRPEAGRPEVVLYREPFGDGAGPGEAPAYEGVRGRERALVSALLARLLGPGFTGVPAPAGGESYGSREGIRCPNRRCVTAHWPEIYEPRYRITRQDPVLLTCRDCGATVRARLVGSCMKRRYHDLTSRQVAKIKRENVVFFADEREAEEAGYVASQI